MISPAFRFPPIPTRCIPTLKLERPAQVKYEKHFKFAPFAFEKIIVQFFPLQPLYVESTIQEFKKASFHQIRSVEDEI